MRLQVFGLVLTASLKPPRSRSAQSYLRALITVTLFGGASAWATPPAQRIVSLNVCADQLVLALAPHNAIASLSFLARSPSHSALHARVGNIQLNRGSAEEVLALSPDLVVAGRYTTRATVAMLRRLNMRVHELDLAETIDDTLTQIVSFASVIGRPERGIRMAKSLSQRLTAYRPAPNAPHPMALIYRANGFTAGRASLAGDLLVHTGFENLAAHAGIANFGHISLEKLVLQRPDVIIFDETAHTGSSLAAQSLRHPLFKRLASKTSMQRIPASLWSCAGPWIADAAERLANIRAALLATDEERTR